MLIVIQLILLVLCAIVAYSYLLRLKRPANHFLNKLPGPVPNLFFGNTLDFIGPTSKLLTTLMRWMKEYGPILKVYDGPFSTIVLIQQQDFLSFVLSSNKLIDKSPQYVYFYEWLGLGLLTSTGSKHKTRRKLLTPAFHFSILENFVDVFDSVSDVLIGKLDKHVGEPTFNIYPLISLCTLDIICEATMGTKVDAQLNENSKYVRSVKAMCSIVTDRNFSPLHPKLYPLTINYFKEKIALKTLHSHTDEIIDKRIQSFARAQNEKDEKDDADVGVKRRLAFLDLLIQATADGVPLSREDIREEVDTFMFEGHDTTSSALSFCLYALSIYPEIQKKAVEEQKIIFNGRDPKTAKATMADIQQMKYLELVIKETLRLYPSVPFYGRSVMEDFEYDGVLYPKGTVLMLFAIGSHRNPEFFPEPEKFIPERFENAEGKNPYVYIPFSAGPRNCIGQKFAILEMKSTISKVLRNFELLPARPALELELAPEVILVSRNGINLSIRRRDYEK